MKLKITIAVIVFAAMISSGCSGGSLFNPKPLVGKDRLVIQITDLRDSTRIYARNIFFDGAAFRFKDVYGRMQVVQRSDSVVVDFISEFKYYEESL